MKTAPEPVSVRVGTIAGPFDTKRAQSLRRVIEQAQDDGITETMWEGQTLDVQFGVYLLEFVETQLGMKGHNGL